MRMSLNCTFMGWPGWSWSVITPLVTGTVVTLIGLTLIDVGITSMGGGFDAPARGHELEPIVVLALGAGIWAAHVLEAASGKKDPGKIVVDEAIGQWVTLTGAAAYNWKSWLAALILFRFFDIVKPPPARQAERLPGGVGIVADDVVAGLFGALVLFAAGCFNLY